jgi:hypothetical protein
MRRSFRPKRAGESRLTPGSLDPARILSVRNRNGSLQRRDAPLGAVRPTIALLFLLNGFEIAQY